MLIEHRNRLKQRVQSDTAKARVVGTDKGQKASRCPAQNPNEGTSSVSARWGKGRIKEPAPGKAVPPRERKRAVDHGCDRQFEQ